MSEVNFGTPQFTEDRTYRGSRFREVVDAPGFSPPIICSHRSVRFGTGWFGPGLSSGPRKGNHASGCQASDMPVNVLGDDADHTNVAVDAQRPADDPRVRPSTPPQPLADDHDIRLMSRKRQCAKAPQLSRPSRTRSASVSARHFRSLASRSWSSACHSWIHSARNRRGTSRLASATIQRCGAMASRSRTRRPRFRDRGGFQQSIPLGGLGQGLAARSGHRVVLARRPRLPAGAFSGLPARVDESGFLHPAERRIDGPARQPERIHDVEAVLMAVADGGEDRGRGKRDVESHTTRIAYYIV
jgi:hypothetical protein